jgi:2,4-dienoyl-CoA reductase-like NADH-dependent reductase (Old Yellow Enzyme family)/thioredoxin reductase
METMYNEEDGRVTDRYLAYVEERAKGGWGLIINEATAVTYEALAFNHCGGMWKDEQIEGASRVAAAAHKHGAKIAIQLIHGGRQTIAKDSPVVAPSPVKCWIIPTTPRELTIEEIWGIINAFGDAALRVKKAGYDAVEIHGAHGYLIQEFTSSCSNKRTDEFGGNLLNRARFSTEIIKDVKKKCGADFPVIYRMSTTELMTNGEGLTIADSRALAKMFEAAGADILHCSVGNYNQLRMMLPPAPVPHAFSADYAEEIRKVVSVPVISVGRYNDPFVAETTLEAGKADLICMARPSLADPDFPNKAQDGNFEEIIQCIGCQSCVTVLYKVEPMKCTVNPRTGRELEYTFEPAKEKKKVGVVGGGIAGMEAAITATRRGHDVTLYEASEKLGGQFLLAAMAPYKQEVTTFIIYLKNQLAKLNVKVLLNTAFTEATQDKEKFDAVILATGAKPIMPKISGIDLPHVHSAFDVLAVKAICGDSVAVIGCGEVGIETAAFLASINKKVAVFEALSGFCIGAEESFNSFYVEYLQLKGVEMHASTNVATITPDSIVYFKDGQAGVYTGITDVVIAVGQAPVNTIEEVLKQKVKKVVVVGDAKVVAQGMEATHAGYEAGYYI